MRAVTRTSTAHLTAMSVSRNLEEAIANYELFAPTGVNAELIDCINARKLNPGFNVISASLHHVIVISLCRIWDNRKGVASLWSINTLLKTNAYQDEREYIVKSSGYESTFSFDEHRFVDWSGKLDRASRSDSLAAIKVTRNNWLAHTAAPDAIYRGVARAEVYGDERNVIEMTIPLVEEANALIGHEFFDFNILKQKWMDEAAIYWSAAASVGHGAPPSGRIGA
ncbi:MAG TPA: hypothetical protein VGH40_15410 [Roseiarcus sp.]